MHEIDGKQCAVVILAAGKGSRMHTNQPKVSLSLLGEPILRYVLTAVKCFCPNNIWLVVGRESSVIREICEDFAVQFVVQEYPLGTGHALLAALPEIKKAGIKKLVVVNGDSPLITFQLLMNVFELSDGCDFVFATQIMESPSDYGRVIRKDGEVVAIVEAKDLEPSLYGDGAGEVNIGVYVISLDILVSISPQLSNTNASNEYYITDMVKLALENNYVVKGIVLDSTQQYIGINTVRELIFVEEVLRKNIVNSFLDKGVILHSPESISIGPFVTIESGVEIYGPCEIYGHTHIATNTIIYSNCWIKNTAIFSGACIQSFSHLEKAIVGENCSVGPYARLRPKSILEPESCIGNFVEVKNSRLAVGSKASHLTYLGDADIGPFTNVGAGTITCNYDGKKKHQTVVGEKVFIGSNTAIVAPVSIGNNAYIGAGSVITNDVPEDTLAVARGRQYMRTKDKKKSS